MSQSARDLELVVDSTPPAQRLRTLRDHSNSLNRGTQQLNTNTDRINMGQSSPIPDSFLESVERSFARAAGEWTGCDWPTSFGNKGLDLNGMTSFQALLMARATAGVEATDWREAVHWLQMIEADAETAEESARCAVQHVSRGNLEAALREAQSAFDLEARYHPWPVWAELKHLLEASNSIAPDQVDRRATGLR